MININIRIGTRDIKVPLYLPIPLISYYSFEFLIYFLIKPMRCI